MSDTPFTGSYWPASGGTARVSWSFATLPGELVQFTNSIGDLTFQAAVRKAFATWESLANIDFTEVADSLAVNIRLGWSLLDGAYGTLAEAHWRVIGKQTIEAEIQFDALDTWAPQTKTAAANNFLAVAIHEIGHAIGLDHVSDATSIMYPYATSVSSPSQSDIAHIQSLYGAPVVQATPDQSVTSPTVATTGGGLEVFRFLDTRTGQHFLTTSAGERDAILLNLPTYQYEGTAFTAPSGDSTTHAVHRFYDTNTGTHFFTADENERAVVQKTLPNMRYEGEAFQSYADAGANGEHHAVYRFYDTASGTHFYTASAAERDAIQKTLANFHFEGIGYYVV